MAERDRAPRPNGASDGSGAIDVVVVVHDRDRTRLTSCLAALAASTVDVRAIVVDNSGAGEPLPGDETDTVHLEVDNRGFGAAANHGVAHSSGPYVALLNDDVEVEPGWLAPLVAELDRDERVGAVQPKLLLSTEDGRRIVNSLGVRLDRHGAGVDIGFGEADTDDDEPLDIELFTGGAVLFRRSFLDDLGGFDERLFLYYEDVDLARRGAERGWRARCAPASVVRHRRGATTDGLGADRALHQERNRLVTATRFADPATVARAWWLGVRRLRHEPRAAHARAFAGALARVPRVLVERLRGRRGGR